MAKVAKTKKVVKKVATKLTFKCSICQNTFPSMTNLRIHLATIHKKHIFGTTCYENPRCVKPLHGTKEAMFQHMIDNHNYESCDLENCTKPVYAGEKNKKSHITYFHVLKSRCKHCAKHFPKPNFEAHVNSCESKDKDPVKCEKCEKKFSNETNLKKHQWVHSEETDSIPSRYDTTECPHCPMNFKRKYMLIKHLQSKHVQIWKKLENKLKPKPSTTNNFCTDCDVQFVTFEAKAQHLRDHICDHCNVRFEYPRQVAKHLIELWKQDQIANISLKAKIFKMESRPLKTSFNIISDESKNNTIENMDENETSDKETFLENDIFPENETSPENDTVSENEPTSSENAEVHDNNKSDQNDKDNITSKTDTCKDCKKTFSSDENIIAHYISDHANHICEMCDIGFTDPKILETHKKKCLMSDDKLKGSQKSIKFPCNQCGRSFMNEQKLKTHSKKEHIRKPKRTR